MCAWHNITAAGWRHSREKEKKKTIRGVRRSRRTVHHPQVEVVVHARAVLPADLAVLEDDVVEHFLAVQARGELEGLGGKVADERGKP